MDAVSATGLTKTFSHGPERITAVDAVGFTVGAGEVVALCGASGSGKSTILNLIAGFDRPDTGKIIIAGFDVTAATDQELDAVRTQVLGFVFQQFNLIAGLTARENVELALMRSRLTPAERRRRADAALARQGLAGMENRRPAQLSGGQQQRVAIARAMVGEPRVVLADEPTAALDRETTTALLDHLTGLAKNTGTAVLISTHDPRAMDRADRVITLQNGRLIP